MKSRQERRFGVKPDNRAKDRHGRSQRARPVRVEPSTFAWIEPLDELEPIIVEKVVEKEIIVEKAVVFEKEVVVEKIVEKPVIHERRVGAEPAAGRAKKPKRGEQPHTIIIGRGPSLAERLALVAPTPKPVLAGACALLIALSGVALISPSGEQATAARSQAKNAAAVAAGKTAIETVTTSPGTEIGKAKTRNPFAAEGYKPSTVGKATGKNGKQKKTADDRKTAKAKSATPAAAAYSPYVASFVTYSSYTPWSNAQRRSGSWIEFDGKPTVKVVAVGAHSVELFAVTDVEVLADKSRNISYSNPMRTVKMGANGVVRFADYRDIQGNDVQYTIRFRGSLPLAMSTKKN